MSTCKIDIIEMLNNNGEYLTPNLERIVKVASDAIYVSTDMYSTGVSMGSHATRDDVSADAFVTMLEYAALTARDYEDQKIKHIKHMREIFYIGLAFAKQLVEMSQHIRPRMTKEQVDADLNRLREKLGTPDSAPF